MVLNEPSAMNSTENQVEILDSTGAVVSSIAGTKDLVAAGILAVIHERLM